MEDKNSISVSGSSCFGVIWQGSHFRCLPSLAFHWGHSMARTHLSQAIDQPLYHKSEASYSNRFPRNLLTENSRAREIVQSVKGLPYKHNYLSSSPRTHFFFFKVWWCMLVILPLWRWRREKCWNTHTSKLGKCWRAFIRRVHSADHKTLDWRKSTTLPLNNPIHNLSLVGGSPQRQWLVGSGLTVVHEMLL